MSLAPTGRERQGDVYLAGARGIRPPVPVSFAGLEAAARKRMSARAFAYVAGGAGLERTMAANRRAFERRAVVPRMLRDVSTRDLSVELFGRRVPAPLLLAPIGVLELAHPQADLAVARGAAETGVPMIFSNQASVAMEDCAAVMGGSPRWFQLYWSTSDELVGSFVSRAEACGCDAIVVTLDTTQLGWRTRDLDLAYLPFLEGKGLAQYTSDPVFARLADDEGPVAAPPGRVTAAAIRTLVRLNRRHPGPLAGNLRSGMPRRKVRTFMNVYSRPSLSWADLPTLRGLTRLPILLKGILHPDDARRAVDEGIDGIVVSNHGGRQVDNSIGSLDALPGIVAAVDGRIPVLLDSGVRSGADAFLALAMGARAVLLGRPYVYALALGGSAGVAELIRNVYAELDLTAALAGCTTLAEAADATIVTS
jgi:isopentenyl diphosphate isomerase/L-lactate dehydrogenase-like FMN-dependent dehydrogenase